MSSTRCAVCKYFRRRCPSDCIFSPHFPPNNPQRFACVHRIYGASNIGKMLETIPADLRGDMVESLYYEAKCRIQDPVYGCVGKISLLQQQIQDVQSQLAKTQAEIAFLDSNCNSLSMSEPTSEYQQYLQQQQLPAVVLSKSTPPPEASFTDHLSLPEPNISCDTLNSLWFC